MIVKAYQFKNLFWNNKSKDKPEYQLFSSSPNYLGMASVNFDVATSFDNFLSIKVTIESNTTFNYFAITYGSQNLYYLVESVNFKSNDMAEYVLSLDVYCTYLIEFFDVNNGLNVTSNVFFRKKHMARFAISSSQGSSSIDRFNTSQLKQPYLYLSDPNQNALNNLDKLYYSAPSYQMKNPDQVIGVEWMWNQDPSSSGWAWMPTQLQAPAQAFNYNNIAPNIPILQNLYLYGIFQMSPEQTILTGQNSVFPYALAPIVTQAVSNPQTSWYGNAFFDINTIYKQGNNVVNLILLPFPPNLLFQGVNEAGQSVNIGSYIVPAIQYSAPPSTPPQPGVNEPGQTAYVIPSIVELSQIIQWSNSFNVGINYPYLISSDPLFPGTRAELNLYEYEPFINLYCTKLFLQNGKDEIDLDFDKMILYSEPPTSFLQGFSFYNNGTEWQFGLSHENVSSSYINFQNEVGSNVHKNINYVLDCESTIPSLSDNWGTYVNNSQNQWALNKNQNAISIANTSADIVSQGVGIAANVAAGFDFESTGESVAAATNMAIGLVNSGFNLSKQALTQKYLNNGMAKDMGRVATMRAANSPNQIPQFFSAPTLLMKRTNDYNANIIFLGFAKNGYNVNNFFPFIEWYNRQIFNYVEIENVVETLSIASQFILPLQIVDVLNGIVEQGLRIWNFPLDWSLIKYNVEHQFLTSQSVWPQQNNLGVENEKESN